MEERRVLAKEIITPNEELGGSMEVEKGEKEGEAGRAPIFDVKWEA